MVKYYLNNAFSFSIKKSTLVNIYYKSCSNAKIINWISIFYNIKAEEGKYYLIEERTTILYGNKSNIIGINI